MKGTDCHAREKIRVLEYIINERSRTKNPIVKEWYSVRILKEILDDYKQTDMIKDAWK